MWRVVWFYIGSFEESNAEFKNLIQAKRFIRHLKNSGRAEHIELFQKLQVVDKRP